MFSASKTAAPSGEYQISRSLRFNSADSAYLNRTPASAGNRRIWTISFWIKKCAVGKSYVNIFGAAGSTTNRTDILWHPSDYLRYYDYDNAYSWFAGNPTALYRDTSAWYHIVLAVDTTQANNADRVKGYVNGQLMAATTDTYAQNAQSAVNSTVAHTIGAHAVYGQYLDAYMTEVNFIDGQALTPSSFGETNAATGVWQPKKYTGSYGTNGFYLNFADNSGTTATTLGKDYSGNGNNWTPNNFSVTAGAGNDSLIDVPTNWDDGGNGRGNYCTLNPLDNGGITLSNGNLQFDRAAASWLATKATFGMSSGKWYWEITVASIGATSYALFGIGTSASSNATYVGAGTTSWGYSGGAKYTNGSSTSYGTAFGVNDVVGVAFDADAGSLTFYNNGVSQGVAFSGLLADTYFPMVSLFGTYSSNINFGQRPFAYTPPSGFKALNTQNLPNPTIAKGNTQFNPVLYTGNGSTQSVTGLAFTPDLVWIKSRSAATDHALYDIIRGAQSRLESNTTDAQVTSDGGLTAFNSGGFSLSTLAQVNTSAATYVAWNWKANGAGVTNTAGTITSTVSANTTAGFSVVTYTGNGADGASYGHGLGVAPSMIITKSRSNARDWAVYHASGTTTKTFWLNLTNAEATVARYTSVSSSVVVLPNHIQTNELSQLFVAYCFAEIAGYSKFGSYIGNGSADGPFIYCGFRPAFVLIKLTSSTYDWILWDTARNTYNVSKLVLWPNLSNTEYTGSVVGLDILSNGFKFRDSSSAINGSGSTYIYAAFAESPFKYANAR